MAAHYHEYRPSPALAAVVECFWTMRVDEAPGAAHRVLPDGCMDLLFDFSGRRGPELVGAMTRPLEVEARADARMLGVRFRPGAAGWFARLRAAEVQDATAPLDVFWANAGELAERAASCSSTEEQVRLLDEALRLRLSRGLAGGCASLRLVQAAARRLESGGGNVPIDELAAGLGCTRQHLAREFSEWVGLSPKQLGRIIRLRRFLAARPTDRSFAEQAADLGFADEAHLNHDCRALAGATPGELRAKREAPEVDSKSTIRRRGAAVKSGHDPRPHAHPHRRFH